jgi:hypothetical protein
MDYYERLRAAFEAYAGSTSNTKEAAEALRLLEEAILYGTVK